MAISIYPPGERQRSSHKVFNIGSHNKDSNMIVNKFAVITVIIGSAMLTDASIFFRRRSMLPGISELHKESSTTSHTSDDEISFYDPISNATLVEPIVGRLADEVDTNSRRVISTDTARATDAPPAASSGGWFSNIRRRPCSCSGLNCGCCAGVDFKRIQFRRQCKFSRV